MLPLHALYQKTLNLSTHRHAKWLLAMVTFTESFIFPIPQDIMMIPMMLAERRKAFLIATIALIASVAGGCFGYLIGFYFFEPLAQPIIAFYGYEEQYQSIITLYQDYGWIIVFFGALTPFPYKIVTISSGFAHLSLPIFIIMTIIARAIRFYLLAALFWYFGDALQQFIEKHFSLLTFLMFGAIIMIVLIFLI